MKSGKLWRLSTASRQASWYGLNAMETIILVGGLGTRLRSVVSDVPKPLAPVQGRPFLEWLMSYCVAQGSSRFILSVGYMADAIAGHFGDNFQGVPVSYSREEEQLGTGGAARRAVDLISGNDPVSLMNGDSFCSVDQRAMQRLHEQTRSDCTIALFPAHKPDRFGRVRLGPEDAIIGFDNGKADIGEVANAGVYILSPDLLRRLNRFGERFSLENQAFPDFIENACRITGYVSGIQMFIDIGTPEDYQMAQSLDFEPVFAHVRNRKG